MPIAVKMTASPIAAMLERTRNVFFAAFAPYEHFSEMQANAKGKAEKSSANKMYEPISFATLADLVASASIRLSAKPIAKIIRTS